MQRSDSKASAPMPSQDLYSVSRRARFRPHGRVTQKEVPSPQMQACNHTLPKHATKHKYEHCDASVISYRSLTERKLSSLRGRYVTSCTEEPDTSFRTVALFLGAWKPMNGRDLARFVDKPRWFECRAASPSALPPVPKTSGSHTPLLSNSWASDGARTAAKRGTTKRAMNRKAW